MTSDEADKLTQAERQEQFDSDRSRHDLYATLAVINGFNQALETSFADLCATYQQALDTQAGVAHANKPENLVDLESDCWRCLARIKSSVERLGTHLKAHDGAQQVNRRNAA